MTCAPKSSHSQSRIAGAAYQARERGSGFPLSSFFSSAVSVVSFKGSSCLTYLPTLLQWLQLSWFLLACAGVECLGQAALFVHFIATASSTSSAWHVRPCPLSGPRSGLNSPLTVLSVVNVIFTYTAPVSFLKRLLTC